MMEQLSRSSLSRAIKVLSRNDQRKVFTITLLQILMGLLDLFGVLSIGLLGAVSLGGLQSQDPGNRVNQVLEFFHLQDSTLQEQSIILGISAVVLLSGKTIFSIFFTRKTLFFLGRRGAKISADLISKLLSQPLLVVQSRTSQETVYAVTTGVERIVLQVLGTSVIWIADFTLLCVLLIGLLVVDPGAAISTFLIFSFVGFLLYRFMHLRAGSFGMENSQLSIQSNDKIVELFASYRESVVRNRRKYYAREVRLLRYSLARTSAELAFLPYVSKYVIETTVVLGAVLIGVSEFFFQSNSQAVATLAVFIAAGTRIAPAVLRLQQGTINIIAGLGVASPTLDLIESLKSTPVNESSEDSLQIIHKGFIPEIHINDVSFTYPNKLNPAITKVSLTIPTGSSLAIVGPSGAGKTTFVDVLLGILSPSSGSVSISGLPPMMAIEKWPGAVAYVPQDIVISSGTIRENVALGYAIEEAKNDLIMEALKIAQLDQFVASLPEGIDTQVGERGAKLSGGQRQRLGIARAMFTRPSLLVLDEATSSLDGETEASISLAMQALKGSVTVVIIAHRLSTVRNVDRVIYFSNGQLLANGTFDEVRDAVPDFDQQAKIMGIQ